MADMSYLFFSFGGQNYSHFLAWFDVYLTNIEVSHPGDTQLLEKGSISVARSLIPGNLCATDKTMEEIKIRLGMFMIYSVLKHAFCIIQFARIAKKS